MQPDNKMIATLKSRKFWATVIGTLAALGVVGWSTTEQAAVIDSIVLIAGALSPVIASGIYVMSTAIEDAANARARSQGKPDAN